MKELIKKLNFDFLNEINTTNSLNKKTYFKNILHKKTHKKVDFYYKYNNNNTYYRGEIALWKAVILQALIDLQSNSKKKIANTYRIKALMWFNLKNEEFLQVCNWAGLDPLYVYEKSQIVKQNNKFFV